MIIGAQLDALRYALAEQDENIPLALDRLDNTEIQSFHAVLGTLERAVRGEMRRRSVPVHTRLEFSADAPEVGR